MAFSNVCNYPGNIIQFTAKWKIFLPLLLLLLRSALAQLDIPTQVQIGICESRYLMNRSAFKGNLEVVLNSLVENVNKTGYNISSHGQNGDKVYGLAQCRGDLNASACQLCVSNATKSLPQVCAAFGSINLSGCFLRFDNFSFYSELDMTWPGYCGKRTDAGVWSSDPSIAIHLSTLTEDAVSSDKSYSAQNWSDVSDSAQNGSEIYALAQCWGDLNRSICRQCLNIGSQMLASCLNESQGQGFYRNCMIIYDTNKFYGDAGLLSSLKRGSSRSTNQAPTPSSSPSRAPDEGKKRPTTRPLVLGLSIAGVVSVVFLFGVFVIWKRKVTHPFHNKTLPGYYKPSSQLSTAISKSKLNYKFQTLQTATKNFNPMNKIGQGGFGSVYKGVIPDGREIAIKRLFSNREESVSEFFNEVNLISCVQHKNLVKLLGCSVDGPDKLLVYEYLPNKSLDNFLFDENMGNMLDWQRRFDIILGTASGLSYLHQESDIRIIHRDIKASNILLDHHFKPKIADFGLVRYFDEDQTHLSTGIVGTRSYMAPEYLVHGHLTEKVDVYAFGVLVLEIISGRRNKTPTHANGIPSLLTMVWNCHLSGTISNIIDPNIQENYQDALQVVRIALLCTQASATLRPSMSEVIMFLTNKDPNLPKASQPPFIDVIHLQSNINSSVAMKHSHSVSANTISTSSFGPR